MLISLRSGSRYKRIVILLIGLNLVSLAVYGIVTLVQRGSALKQGLYNPHVAKVFERDGIMSRPDYVKFSSLHTKLSLGKSFSDEDIDWLVKLVTRLPQPGALPVASAIRHDTGLELLEADIRTGRTTGAQRDKIFDAAVPLLSSKEETGIDIMSATNTLRILNDKRAIPLLIPLVNSPNPNVRNTVQNSLKVMGYSLGR